MRWRCIVLDTLKSEHLPCLTQAEPPYAQLALSTVRNAGSFICHKKIQFSLPLFLYSDYNNQVKKWATSVPCPEIICDLIPQVQP